MRGEPQLGGEGREQLGVAARPAPETVIETDDDLTGAEPAEHDVLDEGLGLHRRSSGVNGITTVAVDPGLGDQREPLLQRGDRRGRPLGLEHLHRLGIERAGER